jgi:outer membrane receptor for ferrienterochelin and colicins
MRNKLFAAAFFVMLPFTMKAQQDSLSNLLELSLEDLMNVKVVTASGFMQTTTEAPSTIQVITAKQIAERGYEQLEDALRDIPGIDMIHLHGYVPTLIYFRGMYGAENLRALLMVDGIPENNIIGSNDMAGPAYSLHNVKRIEVIWGPASALYGANAFGGVINIITKKGEDVDGFGFEKGMGSFNTSTTKVMYGINRSGFDIIVSGSLFSTDGPRFTNRDPNYSASYVDRAYSLNAAMSYQLKRSRFTLGARIYNTPMGYGTLLNSPTVFLGLPPQGYGNSGVIGLIARDVRGERSGLHETYNRTFYLQDDIKLNNRFDLMGRVFYKETGISERSYAYITIDGTKLYRVPTANYSNRIGAEVIANYSRSRNFQFTGGMQFFQENIENGNRRTNLDTNIYFLDGRDTLLGLYSTFQPRIYNIRNNFGSHAQVTWNTRLLNKTSFTIGARYDVNNYYGNPLSPRIAVTSQPTSKFSFKLIFGRAFRAPTNNEINQAPVNFKLKTEKINTYEVNLIYQFLPQLLAQLNGFRNELSDVILLTNLVNLTQNKNPGKFTITGVEAKLNMNFTKTLSSFFNFTYQDAMGKNLVTGDKGPLPGIAKFKANLGLEAKIKELFSVSLTNNWVGIRSVPRTDPYGPVDGYLLTNLSLNSEKFFRNRLSVGFTLRNIFDVKYLDPGIRSADGMIYSTVLEQPGINGLLKIKVDLKND